MRPFIGMGALLLLAIGSMAEDAPDFNREVRPISRHIVSPATVRTPTHARPSCGWTNARRLWKS